MLINSPVQNVVQRIVVRLHFIALFALLSILHFSPRAQAVTVVAVGDAGTIRQSPDGGGNWFIRLSGTPNSLFDLDCIGRYCWAVGNNGTIIRSTDAGNTWNAQISGTPRTLRAVDFINNSVGWAVGDLGTVLHTTDGGLNWVSQTSNSTRHFSKVSFVDTQSGWITGDGELRRTIDGGTNWSFQTPPPGGLSLMQFVDLDFGIGSDGVNNVFTTVDSGSNWSSSVMLPSTVNSIRSIKMMSRDLGYAVGRSTASFSNPAVVWKITNSGTNWQSRDPQVSATFFDIAMLDDQLGWIVGQGGIARRTTDGGQTWTAQHLGTDQILWGVEAFEAHQPGDYDGDFEVTLNDWETWKTQFGRTMGNRSADGNGDGIVNAADYVIWRDNLTANSQTAQSIPEPTTLTISLLYATLSWVLLAAIRFSNRMNLNRSLIRSNYENQR